MKGPRIFVAAAGLLLLTACGKSYVTPDTLVNAPEGLAVKGYDPVAYHRQAKAVKGSPRYQSTFEGAAYQFTNANNQRAFDTEPLRFIPAYGGYCAYAMSNGDVVDINPRNWAIVDGQLYLNANIFAQALWSLDRRGKIIKANSQWQQLQANVRLNPR